MKAFKRDLFEIENAKNLTRDELVATFVPTQSFWRLLSAKNHIVLGARGSGKTAIAKMLAHDHLSRFDHDRAKASVIAKAFIGIYLPTSVEWVGSLKNKLWQGEYEAEYFFKWRLNISTCQALVVTLKSCLECYLPNPGDRAEAERTLSNHLSDSWLPQPATCHTLRQLQYQLEDIEYRKQQQIARRRAMGEVGGTEEPEGVAFDTDLFAPLRRGIHLAQRLLSFPDDSTWLLCLDEAEFLSASHHRILNTHLRSDTGNLKFKITTMPYRHYSLMTNAEVSVDVGHDFEYVYIDNDPVASSEANGPSFVQRVFRKRASVSGPRYKNVTLQKMLGDSPLLTRKVTTWSQESSEMKMLKTYASPTTLERADRLRGNDKAFRDQLARKIFGALLLRAALDRSDDLDVYSGAPMIVRCSDGNPRRLIRLCNLMLLEAKRDGQVTSVSPKAQTRLLRSFGASLVDRLESEEEYGLELRGLIQKIGDFFGRTFLDQPVSTDQVTSVIVDQKVSDRTWKLVQTAVGLGLLFPNTSRNSVDAMPGRGGRYHLAYALAPLFHILPRRGSAKPLTSILSRMEVPSSGPNQLQLINEEGE